jgi:hypothetical protein
MSDVSQTAMSADERHGGDVAAIDKLFADGGRWGWRSWLTGLPYLPDSTN